MELGSRRQALLTEHIINLRQRNSWNWSWSFFVQFRPAFYVDSQILFMYPNHQVERIKICWSAGTAQPILDTENSNSNKKRKKNLSR